MLLFLVSYQAAFSATGKPPSQVSGHSPSVVPDSMMVVGNGTTGPFWLTGFFIVEATATVRGRNGRVYRQDEFTLDPDKGRISFTAPVPSNDTLRVSFLRLNWTSPTVWGMTPPTQVQETGKADPKRVTREPSGGIIPVAVTLPLESRSELRSVSTAAPGAGGGQSIRWSGFKSFSLSTGSGGNTRWSQGLELSLDGELANGLNLKAAVSDRFSGALANGASRDAARVGDLDRLYIEARSKQFFGRMGELTVPGGSGGSPSRQASGARIDWNNDRHEVRGYLGRASGRTVRRRLAVQQDMAGPYFLDDNNRRTGVIPGSVVIWFDGRRLQEGPDRDYVFDPAQSTITFNPSVTIDARSVVVAEFEQALDAYRRTLAGAAWSWRATTDRRRNTVQFRWEGDDPQQPLFGDLSAAQKQALARNPEGEVTTSAADYRGRRRGDYSLAITADGDSVFSYVGPDNGDWRVGFEYVGSGRGRYNHLAEAAYEYVGPGRGAYEPIATLGAPTANVTASESFAFNTAGFGAFQGRVLAHAVNRNRFAAASTRFTSDHFFSWQLTGDSIAGTSSKHLRVEWRRQSSGGAERDLSVDNIARFTGDWGLRTAYFDSSRSEYAVTAATDPKQRVALSLQSGLADFDGLSAWRLRGGSTVRLTDRLIGRVEWRQKNARPKDARLQTTDGFRRAQSSVSFDAGPARLTAGWEEQVVDNTNRLFEPQADYSSARWVSARRGGMIATYRWDFARDSAVALPLSRREASLTLPLSRGNTTTNRLVFARGEESYGDSPFVPFYRGRLNGQWRLFRTAQATVDLRLIRGRTGIEREVYLPTRAGQGQYRLERGEYVPDAHGDYRRVVAPADDLTRNAYDGRQRFVLLWRPTFGGWRWTLESRRELLGQYDPAAFRPGTWLAPWTPVTKAAVPGARTEQHDLNRLTVRPGQATEFSVEWAGDLTVFGLEGERNQLNRFGASARYRPRDKWYLQTAIDYDNRLRSNTLTRTIESRALTWRLTVGGTPVQRVNWSFEARRRTEQDVASASRVTLFGMRHRLHAATGSLSLLVDSDGAWVSTGNDSRLLSPLLAEGRAPGFSLTEFCELRWELPRRVTLKSRLSGDIRRASPDRWRWELETTARF